MSGRHDRWLRPSAIALLAFFIGFGTITITRSAFQQVRKTDLTVYLRAAWAARTGENLYSVTDEHGWHYHYPPTLATLLVPLAQPPSGTEQSPAVPFATAATIWYIFGVSCAIAAVCILATALGSGAVLRDGKYRRWLIHFPLWVSLPAICSSLSRGQVNEFLLILIAAMMVAAVRGQRFLAGVWLAGAISIKLFPVYLLIYPLWKRDWRWLGGTALGLVFGLFVIPAAVVGPGRTWELYRDWAGRVVAPGLTEDVGTDRSRELLGMTSTDSQSFQTVIHNWRHLDRATRPTAADVSTRVAHWWLAAVMTAVTIVIASRSKIKEPYREALALGALAVVMVLSCPVCHLHYFVLLVPLNIALIASHLANGKRVRPALCGVLLLNFFAALLPRLPGLEYSRDVGLAAGGVLLLWAAALIELSGEAVMKVQLPGLRQARAFWSRRRVVVIHQPGIEPRTVPADNVRSR